jgi:hypothetical protein
MIGFAAPANDAALSLATLLKLISLSFHFK